MIGAPGYNKVGDKEACAVTIDATGAYYLIFIQGCAVTIEATTLDTADVL